MKLPHLIPVWDLTIFVILVLAGFIISDQVGALRSSEAFTVAKKSAEFVRLSTIYFSLSVATSLTTTLLISLRILLLRRMPRKTETGHTFNPLLEIPIESALLYSVTLLTFLALDVRKDANLYYAQNIHAQMTVRFTVEPSLGEQLTLIV